MIHSKNREGKINFLNPFQNMPMKNSKGISLSDSSSGLIDFYQLNPLI